MKRNTRKQLLAWILLVAMVISQLSVLTYAEPIAETSVLKESDLTDVMPEKVEKENVKDMQHVSLKEVPARYTDINVGEAVRAEINNNEEYAYFRFIPAKDTICTFTSFTDEDTYGIIYGADGQLLVADDDSGPEANFAIEYEFETGKVYYLCARFYDSEKNGSFKVALVKTKSMFSDFTEIHVGDSLLADITVPMDTAYFRFMPAEDVYCAFLLESGEHYGILYDANGEMITRDEQKIEYRFKKGKTYYFGVKLYDYDTGSIHINLSLAKDMTIECSDIYINDSIDVSISAPDDIMYYRFTPTEDFYGTFISHSEYVCAYLFDENGEFIKGDNRGSYEGFRVEYQFKKNRVYYLGARYADKSRTGTFNVKLKRANNMFTDYKDIRVGDKLSAELSDNDEILYYRFVPEKSIYCEFGSDDDLGFKLGIYDSEGYRLHSVGGSGSYSLKYQFDAGETYYLGVSLYSAYSVGEFEVFLRQKKDMLIDYRDYQLGDQMQITPDEEHYFRFIAPEEGLYEFLDDSHTIRFDAYDSDRYEITSYDSGRIFYCAAEETYYLSAQYASDYNDVASLTARIAKVECEDIKNGETISYKESANDRTKVIRFIPDETHGYELNYETQDINSIKIFNSSYRTFDSFYLYNNNGKYQTAILYAGATYYIVAENEYDAENPAFKYSISYGEKGHDYGENDSCVICGQTRWYSIEGEVMTILHDTPDFSENDYFFDDTELINTKSVVVNEGVKHLGNYLFKEFSDLNNISLPDSLESIGEGAFYDCRNLSSITIPKNVTSIGKNAFRGSYEDDTLPEIIIDSKNTSFEWKSDMLIDKVNGRLLFAKQDISGDLIVPTGIKTIDEYAFYLCESIENVMFPEGLVEIGDYAFEYCSMLTEINLPESLLRIGEYTFSHTDIYSLTIPENVEEMDDFCFSGCENLEEVVFKGNVPKVSGGRSYFYNYLDGPLVIYYPNNKPSWNRINSSRERWDFTGRTANWVPYTNLDDAKKQYNTISEPGFSDGDIISFNEAYMHFDSLAFNTLQYPCEEAGGIYFLQHGLLKFYNMKT